MMTESPIVVGLARVIMVGVGVGRVVASRPQGEHISLVMVRVGIARKETDEGEEIFIINTGLSAKEVLSIEELICAIQEKTGNLTYFEGNRICLNLRSSIRTIGWDSDRD